MCRAATFFPSKNDIYFLMACSKACPGWWWRDGESILAPTTAKHRPEALVAQSKVQSTAPCM